jgi:hypothetical protein
MANHGGVPSTSPTPSQDACQPQGLANEVRAELAAAGLPILPPDHDLQTEQVSGVSVEVDEESVWVSWEIHSPLSEASQRAFKVGAWRSGNPDGFDGHPAMRHCWVARNALTEALTTILRSLGYGIQVDADEYRPGELLVSARAPGPRWRDPAVPPLAGSAGYSPGVRVRLLTGEFAGSVTTIVTGTYRLSVPGPPLRYSVKHPNGEGELDVAPEDVTLADDDT